ncbi:MAG: hypothetical protein HOP09_09525 [Hyphomicrobium sp.]|nr:hypothetical protein [Hyphomicrobium sp.]
MQDDAAGPKMTEAPAAPQPYPLDERALRAVAGTALSNPFFDGAALFALRHWFFPVSRLWAAAREAHGDPQRFYDAVPMPPRFEDRGRLTKALAAFEQARAAANAIEAEWDRVFFGPKDVNESERQAVEAARRSLRHAYNATRRHFRFLVNRQVPRVKLAIATPAEVEAVYAAALGDGVRDGIVAFTAAPDPAPDVEVSRAIISPTGRDFWLRFKSPSARLGDMVYARVHEPAGVANPPTIIFGHGICVEFDHWRGLIDECHALARLGFRVIRPEAPWHGRRNRPGQFGGENIIASFPLGTLDTLFGAVQEWAVLAAWARATSKGPMAFGGSSLGAMTSQFAADRAADWPAPLRPDALLLLTHTGDLSDVVLKGALAELWMSPADVKAKGWTEDTARDYLSLLQPARPLSLPASRIVSVLGRRDAVLPFESGRQLVESWCVPEHNCFVFDRGHFSVPMTLVRNDAPLKRFAEVMAAIQSA